MVAQGNEVSAHHIDEVSPKDLPPADLFIFGSPTHFGKAPGNIMRFVKKVNLPSGASYAVFASCTSLTSMTFEDNAPTVGPSWIANHYGSLMIFYYEGATGFTSP